MRWNPISLATLTVVMCTLRPIAAAQGACGERARPSAFAARQLEPSTTKKRAGDTSELTKKAILQGLGWLAHHQNPDGSWGADTLKQRCNSVAPCFDPREKFTSEANDGLSALALLCFFGAGYGPDSDNVIVDAVSGKSIRAGDVVGAGVRWLAARQPKDGWFMSREWFFAQHAIVTTALCEAYGMGADSPSLRAAKRSLGSLIRAQAPSPTGTDRRWGWSPVPNQLFKQAADAGDEDAKKRIYQADMISTSSAVAALNAARLAGLTVPGESMAGAFDYAMFVSAADGRVGYNDAKLAGATLPGKNDQYIFHPGTFSALGMWTRMATAHDSNDPFLDLAARQLVADLPVISKNNLSIDYTYWYWATLALRNLDGPESPRKSGKHWSTWNKAVLDALLPLQDHTERACSIGGWIVPDRWAFVGGPLYTTAMSVLTLEACSSGENVLAGKRIEEPKAIFLTGWTDDEFQASAKSAREAASRQDADAAGAFDDALAYCREVAAASEKTPDDAARRARRELADFSAPEVILLVDTLVREDPQRSLTWMLARAGASITGGPCSRWLVDEIEIAARGVGSTQLGAGADRARRIALVRLDGATALLHARHATLARLRDMCASSTADVIPLADSIASTHADLDGRSKSSKSPEALRAAGTIARSEGGARARLDEIVKPRAPKEWWRSVRGLYEKLVEIDAAGVELRRALGAEPMPPALDAKPDATAPADIGALQARAAILGGERFMERALLGRFLRAHPEIAIVPLPDCRVAVFDTRDQEPGIVLHAATLIDPYMKIVPR